MMATPVTSSAEAISREPTYKAVLEAVGKAFGMSPDELRSRPDEPAAGARDAFLWICDQVKSGGTLAAASYIGVPVADSHGALANIERQRAATPQIAIFIDELLLTLHCEAAVLAKLGIIQPNVSRPFDIARRVLVSKRAAGMVSIEDIQSLAAAYLTLAGDGAPGKVALELRAVEFELANARAGLKEQAKEIERLRVGMKAMGAAHIAPQIIRGPVPVEVPLRAFVDAAHELETASGPHERIARRRFEDAAAILKSASEQLFNIARSSGLKGASK